MENGTLEVKESIFVYKGAYVYLDAVIPDGMVFAGWEPNENIAFDNINDLNTPIRIHGPATIRPILKPVCEVSIDPEPIPFYALSVSGGSGSGTYKPGTVIEVQAAVPEGKLFKQWFAEGLDLTDRTAPAFTFTMPENNVYLNAAFVDAPTDVYTLTVVSGTGSGNYPEGTKVTVRAIPPEGMVFKNWTSEGIELTEAQRSNNTLVFEMPASHVVLEPVFEKASYQVNVVGGSGDGSYHPGDLVTVTADTVPGHAFTHWTAEGLLLENATEPILTFRMPGSPVFLTAHFADKENAAVVTFRIVNGTWDGHDDADRAVEITLTDGKGTLAENQIPTGMVANPGFEAGAWDVTPNTEENAITNDVVYTYTFTKISEPDEPPFTDIAEDKWYSDAVQWAVDNSITEGFTDGTFRPNEFCTRAQVVTFLWRAQGCPTYQDQNNPFVDIEPGKWYYDAVLWGAENGIVEGFPDKTFRHTVSCTRAQVVTFLYRNEK